MLVNINKNYNRFNLNFGALNPSVSQAVENRVINRRNFVPTPENIADEMIYQADIQPCDKILEPSAGQGHIIKRIHSKKPYMAVDAVEKHPVLFNELQYKSGINAIGQDILEYNPGTIYDKIIMNPPFNNGNPIKHGLHCFHQLLKAGGTLVTIVPNYVLEIPNKFLDLIQSQPSLSKVIDLTEEAFLDSDLPAKVKTSIVILKKPK
jgi:phospholipid N-methyltransferase